MAAALAAALHPEEDLLDMPIYTASSVKAVDDSGAEKAKLKSRVLAAGVGEKFYAVHSKAQRRVPIPEGLDLDKPFNSSALNKLLAVEIPENLTLATLSFTTAKNSSHFLNPMDSGHGFGNGDDTSIAKLSTVLNADDDSAGGGKGKDKSSYSAFSHDFNPLKGSAMATHAAAYSQPARSAEDNLFYLSGTRSTQEDVVPLSQILADTFEDNKKSSKGGKKGKKGEKGEKGKKHHHHKDMEMDNREMLPAGADSSDDEDAKGGKRNKAAGGGGYRRKRSDVS
jgi:hypothetical protein